ncbi:MAG: hypothetical protein JEZ08_02450 [Clostridiales bacterium]|nr:hypothetical protein [Clostridiales bacterium]
MRKCLIIILSMLLIGCGENNDELENADIAKVDVDKDQIEITTDDGTEMTVTNDIEESIDIPESFPEHIIPIFKDSHIVGASINADGSIMIVGMIKDEMKDFVDFYKDALDGAEVTLEQNAENTYMTMGNLDGIAYTITIAEDMEADFKYAFTIVVMEQLEDMEEEATETSETEKATAEFVIPEVVSWPEDYPEESVPVYSAAYTEAKAVMKQGSDTMVALMTEDELDIVAYYYEELLMDAPDYSTMNLQGTLMFSGTIDDVMITVMLLENDGSLGEDMRYKTLIQIVY